MLKLPTRLMLMVRAKDSSLWAPSRPTTFSAGAMPAQLTRPPSTPISRAAAKAPLALSSLVTSVATKRAEAPSSAATASPASLFTSASTALPPAATIIRAVAAPRPEPPPVTTNTLLLISMKLSSFLWVMGAHGARDVARSLGARRAGLHAINAQCEW